MSESPRENKQADTAAFPTAEVRATPAGRWRRVVREPMWWLAGLCVLLAVFLVATSFWRRGPVISIHFQQGHGIKPGDVLRHRGIAVGEVTSVELDDDLQGVDVHVTLQPRAAGLAREGSRFWIERPQISLARVRGLETVVGAKYIGVLPGPAQAPRQRRFDGAETPLMMLDAKVVEITIRFREGYGLAAGDDVKYRGMTVGEVTSVELNDDQTGVDVGVRLLANASRLARVGSQFWVERPDIGLTGVRGLETVVGGRYIAVAPGPEETEPLRVFDGLDSAPPSAEREPGGLEIVLQASHRSGLKRGVPVMYRGIAVGHVMTVGLSSDAVSVEVRAYIQPAYRGLVQGNTVFWNQSGIDVHFGVTGLDFKADSLSSVALGAVAMATPDARGKPVTTGHRFEFHPEPEPEWLTWQPRIPVGTALLPPGATLPQPLRAKLVWRESTLGFKRQKEAEGWVLPLTDGRIIGPVQLLLPSADAVEGQGKLEVAGEAISVTSESVNQYGALAGVAVEQSLGTPWATERLRTAIDVEECVIVGGGQETLIPLPAARLEAADGHWTIDPSLTIDVDWNGASVVAVADGKLIGLLTLDGGVPRVSLLTETLIYGDR